MTATFRATKLDDSSGKLDTDIANSTFEKGFYESDIVMSKAEKGFYESDIVMSKAEKGFYGSDIAMLKAEKGFYGSDIAMLKAEKGFYGSDIAMLKAEKGFYGTDIVISKPEKPFWNPDFVNYGREWLLKVSNQVTYFHAEGFGNPHQSIHRNCFCPPFNCTDIDGMKFGFFCEFFLAQFRLFSANPNGLPKNPTVFQFG